MRKRITLLITALMLALTMSFGSVAAFAANAPAGCDKVRGTIVCEESGKNENQPKFQQTTFKKGRRVGASLLRPSSCPDALGIG
jgi:Spy/CpxP family protein refolding chaperone